MNITIHFTSKHFRFRKAYSHWLRSFLERFIKRKYIISERDRNFLANHYSCYIWNLNALQNSVLGLGTGKFNRVEIFHIIAVLWTNKPDRVNIS